MPTSSVHRNRVDEIESLIDRMGLTAFLDATSTICSEKAEHISVNWQDRPAARKWEAAAKRLHTLHLWAKETGPK